jgi:hypothetical protein
MTTAPQLDELGSVDWVVIEFPGGDFGKGHVAPILKDLVERGLVRVLDLLLLRKDGDGEIEPFELSDPGAGDLADLRAFERDLVTILSEQDVADLAVTMAPGTSAAVLVWENLWSAPFGAAVRHAGGQLVASGRIPVQAVLAALEDDVTEEGS